jgi:hypothetical protein
MHVTLVQHHEGENLQKSHIIKEMSELNEQVSGITA